MQERQTQVLALPARAEGRDRETEGILGKKKGSPGSRKRSMVFQDMPNVSMQVLEIASIILNASREYSEYSADPWAGYMPTVATVGRYRSRWKREEAGEEELAPADDGSQAPVEASHACVCPVSSASLLSLPLVPG
ncbi:Signal transducer and activator of transcription 3.1 [Dissostichus eleginoides]|uniref:Signal transducer and activator of transcription 3.1 n=1 Tax=Dissostichus eleginoides TaxID=100907 RepID=A0AAD9B5P6_DISEL|nr:Signal transducer and activator of transcription 3.1 [Dissostichus eleginoides]